DGLRQLPLGQLLMHRGSQLAASDATGQVTLTSGTAQLDGLVMVVAPGHAPATDSFQLDEKDNPKQLTVKLGQEGRIAGKVVAEDGSGVAGARVWAVNVPANTSMGYG